MTSCCTKKKPTYLQLLMLGFFWCDLLLFCLIIFVLIIVRFRCAVMTTCYAKTPPPLNAVNDVGDEIKLYSVP